MDANLTGSDRPERIELLGVSPNYFSLLGAKAKLGRVFGPQDKAQGFAESAIISYGLWQRLFGADPNILGRKIYVDSDAYTIVGVLPADFRHPGKTLRDAVDVWATAGFEAKPFPPLQRDIRLLPGAIGRLKSGLSVAQAQSKLDAFVGALRTESASTRLNNIQQEATEPIEDESRLSADVDDRSPDLEPVRHSFSVPERILILLFAILFGLTAMASECGSVFSGLRR